MSPVLKSKGKSDNSFEHEKFITNTLLQFLNIKALINVSATVHGHLRDYQYLKTYTALLYSF